MPAPGSPAPLERLFVSDPEGFLRVTVRGAGGDVTRVLDVFLAFDALAAAARRGTGVSDADARGEYKRWAEGVGFPGLSAFGVDRLARAVLDAYATLNGRGAPDPA